MIVLRVVVEQVDKNLAAIAAQTKAPEYMEQMRISGMVMTWNKWECGMMMTWNKWAEKN